MRRSTLVGVLLGALIGLAVAAGISLAGGSSSSSSDKSASAGQGSFRAAYAKRGSRGGGRRWHGHEHGMGFGPLALALNGLADRLDVTPAKLREAGKGVKKRALDRAGGDATIPQDERDPLDACFASRGQGSGCDRAKARAAH